jgi:GT2 family glycosyltransferase/glycosyltransferase involved in cell wall biosynthesis
LDLLKYLRRLSLGGQRWLPMQSGPVAWFAVFNGGVVVAVSADVRPEEVRVAARAGRGPDRVLPIARITRTASEALVTAALDPALFGTASAVTVSVTVRGRTRRRRFTTGPGLYAGHLDGVRNYGLEGWISPLFSDPAPQVQLLVDGVAGEPVGLDRFRRELMLPGGQGGWNGFRLLLPHHVLDGSAHRLGVRAGDTVLDLGHWSARPKFHIEAANALRLSGWYFDRSTGDVPTTIRIVSDGITRAEVKTHARPDIKATFGRNWASFSFDDVAFTEGSTLVAGPEGTGVVVGQIGDAVLARVAARRGEARALLLGGEGRPSEPTATLPERSALRRRIREEDRVCDARIAFRPSTRASIQAAPDAPRAHALRVDPGPLPPVCAIVPVYNGLDDLKLCLASLIPQLRVGRIRALVINDGSPDPAVAIVLADLAARGVPGLTILHNPENLGFIGTVNRGLSLLEPGEDALLVNADTILPPGAVERLSRHCHGRRGIASVTPMSNTATLLSFPSLTLRNRPALGLDVEALDRAFQAEGAEPAVIPTGVGFCMHMNRAALDEVGPLSPDWGRGYCEEVDWCLSARDLGWIHLAATDTFVMHEGSVSFTNTTRLELLATNHARLEALYPEYNEELTALTRSDPFERLRIAVLLRLLAGRFRRFTLHLTHGLGGGTKRYVNDLRMLPREQDHEVAILAPVDDTGEDTRLELAFDGAETTLTLSPDRVPDLLSALEASGVSVSLHVNSRLTYGSGLLERLLSGDRPYVVMLHDFQWYCPRVNLTDGRKFYCGEPPPDVCQLCVGGGVDYNFADQAVLIETDLDAFLRFNTRILRGAQRLLAPSQDTADRYRARLGLDDIVVVPHPEPHAGQGPQPPGRVAPVPAAPPAAGPLRIAVVGAIGAHKGFELLLRMAERAARDRIPFFLTVIGYTPDTPSLVRYGNVEVTGAYAPAELGARLAAAEPDFVLLPSVWPETYSYVLSEIWDAGFPVVAFDFGAPAERIRSAGGGVLIPPTRDPRALLDTLFALRDGPIPAEVPALDPTRYASLDAYARAGGIGPDGFALEPG